MPAAGLVALQAVSSEVECLLGSSPGPGYRPPLAVEVSLVIGQAVPPVDLALEVPGSEALQFSSLGDAVEQQVAFCLSCCTLALDFF